MKTKILTSVVFLTGLLLVPISTVLAQFVESSSSGGKAIPELPIGALSLLVAAGASVVIGSKILKKKKKKE